MGTRLLKILNFRPRCNETLEIIGRFLTHIRFKFSSYPLTYSSDLENKKKKKLSEPPARFLTPPPKNLLASLKKKKRHCIRIP